MLDYVLSPKLITRGGGWGDDNDTLLVCLLEKGPTKGRSPINRWWYYTCSEMRGKNLAQPNNGCSIQSSWLSFFIFKPIIYLHKVHQDSKLSTTTINGWKGQLPWRINIILRIRKRKTSQSQSTASSDKHSKCIFILRLFSLIIGKNSNRMQKWNHIEMAAESST